MNNNGIDSITKLHNIDIDKLSEREAKDLLIHSRNQFIERYKYLVGEWRNARRAKSTRDGQFVTKKEVKDYLDGE